MMDVKLTQLENGTELYAEASTGNKQWVAEITDTHPKYNFEREFIAYQKPKTSKRYSGREVVQDGAVIEMARYTHSGKNDTRRYYQLVGDELHKIDETDVTKALEEIVIDVGPDQEVVDELTTFEGVGDTIATALANEGFESIEDVKSAERDNLLKVNGIGEKTATVILGEEDNGDDGELVTLTEAPTSDQARRRHEVADHVANKHGRISEPDTEVVADGGIDVRSYQDLRHNDDLVREYSTPSELLYAYRDDVDDSDKKYHIVVSRGNQPDTRWTKRVPAKRTYPVPGQKLWTIPDNWEPRIYSKRDNIAYAIYHIPETDRWVKVSVPTNDWVVDAWYRVHSVGELTAGYVGDIAPAYEVRKLARRLEEEDDDPELAEAFRNIADHWDLVERAFEEDLEFYNSGGIFEHTDADFDRGEWLTVDDEWCYEPFDGWAFRPGAGLKGIDWHGDITIRDVILELSWQDLLPKLYPLKLSIDDSDVGMKEFVRGLVEADCSPAESLDYYMVEAEDMTQTAWANERGIDQSTVSANVKNAKRSIGK